MTPPPPTSVVSTPTATGTVVLPDTLSTLYRPVLGREFTPSSLPYTVAALSPWTMSTLVAVSGGATPTVLEWSVCTRHEVTWVKRPRREGYHARPGQALPAAECVRDKLEQCLHRPSVETSKLVWDYDPGEQFVLHNSVAREETTGPLEREFSPLAASPSTPTTTRSAYYAGSFGLSRECEKSYRQ